MDSDMRLNGRRLGTLFFLVVSIAGCSSNSGTPVAPINPGGESPSATPTASAKPSPTATPTVGPSSAPTATPTPSPTPTVAPATVYYVDDAGTNQLTAYPFGATGDVAPARTVSGSNTGLAFPRRMLTDAQGDIIVANAQSGTVTIFAPAPNGNQMPARTLTNAVLAGVDGLAVDAAGNLYAASCAYCYLGNQNFDAISVFAPGVNGSTAPLRTIEGTNTGLSDPTDVGIDAGGTAHVTNYGANTITSYAAGTNGNVAPTATLGGASTAIANPECVAFDSSGNEYVCDSTTNAITVYPPGASGNSAPIRTLVGTATLLNDPTSIVFDTTGRMYVANPGGNTITVYAANAANNTAPIFSIGGPNTNLSGAIALTLGS
jgi:sugar lactone lactonase YvrE